MGNVLSVLFSSTPTITPLQDPKPGEPCSLLVTGVCEAWTQSHLCQFLKRSNIPFSTVSKVRGQEFAILEFKSNKDRQFAYNFLSGCQLANNHFEVRPFHGYDPPTMPYATQAEILKYSTIPTQPIHDRLYPLAKKEETERLNIKVDLAKQYLKDIIPQGLELNIISSESNYPHIESEDDETNDCHLTIELTVGYSKSGEIAVGFNNSSKTYVTVHPVDSTFGLPSKIILISELFSDFVKESPFPPFDNNSLTGKWRNLLVRYSSTQEIMLVVVTYGGLPLKEIQRLEDLFQNRVQSLYWSKTDESYYDVTTPNRVLFGTPTIIEKIGSLKFAIQPFVRFPGNIKQFQKMMDWISTSAKIGKSTVLVDVGCGIGFSCIYLADKVKRSVGFDLDEHMINGSNKNVELNDLKNVFFLKGSAETGLDDLANNITANEEIVCLFNTINPTPPVSSIKAVASCNAVKKFVYISDSLYTFAYDIERFLLEGNTIGATPFTIDKLQLFDFQPLSQVSTVVGLFVRK